MKNGLDDMTMIGKIETVWRLAAMWVGSALLCIGCTSQDEPQSAPQMGEESDVPVVITFGVAWQQDEVTRVAPPGSEITVDVDGWDETNADKVRIVTFRRKDIDNDLQEDENKAAFIYDPTNDYTVDCVKGNRGENFTAQATLHKIYGYEYRVVGIAYDSKRENAIRSNGTFSDGEESLFVLNVKDGVTFDQFAAIVNTGELWSEVLDDNNHCLNRKMAFVPEFFYGYCTTAEGDEIIKFAEQESDGKYNKNKPLKGILYRGVAKIQVNLTVSNYEESINEWTLTAGALLATNVNTETGLSSYDDFLTPYSPVPDYVGKPWENYTGTYTLIGYQPVVESEGVRTVSFTAFVLPAKMNLAVRFLATRQVVLTYYSAFNGQIHVDDVTYNDGSGPTGVVSPDVDGNLFYFRRNHKYVLSGNSNSILSHSLD